MRDTAEESSHACNLLMTDTENTHLRSVLLLFLVSFCAIDQEIKEYGAWRGYSSHAALGLQWLKLYVGVLLFWCFPLSCLTHHFLSLASFPLVYHPHSNTRKGFFIFSDQGDPVYSL